VSLRVNDVAWQARSITLEPFAFIMYVPAVTAPGRRA
jgi:hypothetical protein